MIRFDFFSKIFNIIIQIRELIKDKVKIFYLLYYTKSGRIRSYFGPHFPAFGLNTLYSVRMRENVDQNNSKYGQFPRSDNFSNIHIFSNIFANIC